MSAVHGGVVYCSLHVLRGLEIALPIGSAETLRPQKASHNWGLHLLSLSSGNNYLKTQANDVVSCIIQVC